MVMKSNHRKSGGRIEINVGGTIFETTVSTLTRVDNILLSTMVADRWRNPEELFVDRNPTYFAKILDYLRDGENLTLPEGNEAREALRKEADFYNFPGLANMCVPSAPTDEVDNGITIETINDGDFVQWRESAIEKYWKYLVRHLYECEYPPDERRVSRCMACAILLHNYVGPTATVNDDSETVINYEDWTLLTDHMPFMRGEVSEVDMSCCDVQWGRELRTHVPLSALHLARPKMPAQNAYAYVTTPVFTENVDTELIPANRFFKVVV